MTNNAGLPSKNKGTKHSRSSKRPVPSLSFSFPRKQGSPEVEHFSEDEAGGSRHRSDLESQRELLPPGTREGSERSRRLSPPSVTTSKWVTELLEQISLSNGKLAPGPAHDGKLMDYFSSGPLEYVAVPGTWRQATVFSGRKKNAMLWQRVNFQTTSPGAYEDVYVKRRFEREAIASSMRHLVLKVLP